MTWTVALVGVTIVCYFGAGCYELARGNGYAGGVWLCYALANYFLIAATAPKP